MHQESISELHEHPKNIGFSQCQQISKENEKRNKKVTQLVVLHQQIEVHFESTIGEVLKENNFHLYFFEKKT